MAYVLILTWLGAMNPESVDPTFIEEPTTERCEQDLERYVSSYKAYIERQVQLMGSSDGRVQRMARFHHVYAAIVSTAKMGDLAMVMCASQSLLTDQARVAMRSSP